MDTQTQCTDLWTQWGRGGMERAARKHTHWPHGNKWPGGLRCIMQSSNPVHCDNLEDGMEEGDGGFQEGRDICIL